MVVLYLLIAGFGFFAHDAALLGIITFVFALCAGQENQRLWTIIIGVGLMMSGAWFIPGLIGLLIGVCDDRK